MLEFAAEHAFPLGMSNDQAGLSALDYAIQNQWWQVNCAVSSSFSDSQRVLVSHTGFNILPSNCQASLRGKICRDASRDLSITFTVSLCYIVTV